MIRFDDWEIFCTGQLLAMQHDNLTRELAVAGDLPEGYEWEALVQTGKYSDIIPLPLTDKGAAVTLTAEQLSQSGAYSIQLRGTLGEKVRHTNVIRVTVGRSMSGDEFWPEIPSSFTNFEKQVLEKAEAAAQEAAEEAVSNLGTAGSDFAVELLARSGILTPAYENGVFYTDGSGAIYIL